MDIQQVVSQPGIHPEVFADLAVRTHEQYKRSGSIEDIDNAAAFARDSVLWGFNGDTSLPKRLSNLGVILESRYVRTGNMDDLEEGIVAAVQAIQLTPLDHAERAVRLSNFGNLLASRYARTGRMADLEVAIRVTRWATESTPHDHPDRVALLNNLGIKLACLYERSGEIAHLEEAIAGLRQAVNLAPHGHVDRPIWLTNLGNSLQSKYERTANVTDLDRALAAAREAVNSALPDHPDRAIWLNNLGNKLQSRYERIGETADLDEAVEVARQAVQSTPHDHISRSNRLNNLGNKLKKRYERTGEVPNLEEAIDVAKQAIKSTPRDHPDTTGCLFSLGTMLESQYEHTGVIDYLKEASETLQGAWKCVTATPFRRIEAAARNLKLLWAQGKIDTAIQLGYDIIDLLPTVNTKLLSRADQQFVVSTFTGVAADLCSYLLASDQRADDALDCLEKGRAVIIGQLIDAQSNLSSLEQQYPDIAHRYERLRDEVNMPLGQLNHDEANAQAINRRREAVAELDACIQEIRGIAGQERFLVGQTAAEMRDCATGGTIAIVNVTKFGSDAILVSSAAIKTFALPQLLTSDAEVWLKKEWTGRRSERLQKNKEYCQFLAWLWNVCASKILDEIDRNHDAVSGLPRIWWIGTGLASSMPFHAAGIHSPNSTDNIISKTISSYTPSIKTLSYAQHRVRAMGNTGGSLMIATMPTTPGHADLRRVGDEKAKVVEMVNGRLPVTALDLPSVDQVIHNLRNCRIAHFACHGSTDLVDPSKSGLILRKQGLREELEPDWLTVYRISGLSLESACIAYLSACSTAQNKVARLADEAIHVVSGFQVAGFPHVVGCLWPSIDRVCMEVASAFYASLLRQGVTGWNRDGRIVASALQQAVLTVRERDMEFPLNWAPFVHYGA